MAQQLELFAAKTDDLSLVLETHMVDRKHQLPQVVLRCAHVCTHAHIHMHTY